MSYSYFAVGVAAAFGLAFILANKNVIDLPRQVNRVGHIDGLRGYLAFAVMCHHFFIWMMVVNGGSWEAPNNNFTINLGQAGVSVFFMVTGALFYSKICENPFEVDWVKLYISRFFRLTPLMAFAATIMFLIAALKSGQAQDFYKPAQINALLKWIFFLGQPKMFDYKDTGNIIANVTWSLRFEWKFYLSLPIVGLLFYALSRLIERKYVLFSFWLVSYIVLFYDPEFAGKMATFAPLFLTGMLAAELRRDSRLAEKLSGVVAATIGLFGLFCEMFFFKGSFGAPQFVLLAVFFIPVVCGNSYFSLFSKRVSIFLGEISYSVYLLHGILLFIIFQSVLVDIAIDNRLGLEVLFPLAITACVVVTTMTHKYIELPGIAMGRAVNQNRPGFLRAIFAARK